MSKVRLAIVYYSTYGTNHQMAQIAAEAAVAAGAEVRVAKVRETAPADVVAGQNAWKSHAEKRPAQAARTHRRSHDSRGSAVLLRNSRRPPAGMPELRGVRAAGALPSFHARDARPHRHQVHPARPTRRRYVPHTRRYGTLRNHDV